MNWKEFFRPSIGKVILLVILLILGVVFGFMFRLGTRALTVGDVGGCPPQFTKIDPSFVTYLLYPFGLLYGETCSWILIALPNIMYLYIISCLIFWIYNKIKK